jgi:hypothetical protein
MSGDTIIVIWSILGLSWMIVITEWEKMIVGLWLEMYSRNKSNNIRISWNSQ